MTYRAISLAFLFFGATAPASPAPFTQDGILIQFDARGRTIRLGNLYSDASCFPAKFSGKVVKREFAPDALTITGFVVEMPDGSRSFINAGVPDNLSRATNGVVTQGLQTLLKIGRHAKGQVLACGASGGVLTLEEIE